MLDNLLDKILKNTTVSHCLLQNGIIEIDFDGRDNTHLKA